MPQSPEAAALQLQCVSGQYGGTWLQLLLHQSSLPADAPIHLHAFAKLVGGTKLGIGVNAVVVGPHPQCVAGQYGGLWRQFWLHHSSVPADAPIHL